MHRGIIMPHFVGVPVTAVRASPAWFTVATTDPQCVLFPCHAAGSEKCSAAIFPMS